MSETGRFACAKCDGLFVRAEFNRMPDGKYCKACLEKWKAENAKVISAMSVGERFKLMLLHTIPHIVNNFINIDIIL